MLLLSVLKSECAQNGYNVASMCTKYAKGFFVAQESFQKESGGKKNKSTAHGPSLDQVIQDDITAPFSERESKISVECGTPNTLSLNNTGKHKMFLDLKCTEYTDKLTGASVGISKQCFGCDICAEASVKLLLCIKSAT